ncbi:hypothetical protein FIV34_11095 [Luteibacter pinisoli]|uniref:Uncharacterized protein n=1 Tax=Luteibacter pinisoli TaxID=2589080 RepID=A0A4Y5Z579_9GAMM|nr:hypothetical protein [Luteibacter pinisoli]QDE39709.1 hypothetical protein FIV34_11095 [Luteibacter pinisoli]
MNADGIRRRIFIFYPGINQRTWRVIAAGGSTECASEGQAVAFAFQCAHKAGGSRMVDVLKETISGAWIPLIVPIA